MNIIKRMTIYKKLSFIILISLILISIPFWFISNHFRSIAHRYTKNKNPGDKIDVKRDILRNYDFAQVIDTIRVIITTIGFIFFIVINILDIRRKKSIKYPGNFKKNYQNEKK